MFIADISQLSNLSRSSYPNGLRNSIGSGACHREARVLARSVGSIPHLTPSVRPFRPVAAQHQLRLPCKSATFLPVTSVSRAAPTAVAHRPLDAARNRCEQLTRHRCPGHLKSRALEMPDHLRSDLDQFLPQCDQRRVPHGPRQRKAPQEVPIMLRRRRGAKMGSVKRTRSLHGHPSVAWCCV